MGGSSGTLAAKAHQQGHVQRRMQAKKKMEVDKDRTDKEANDAVEDRATAVRRRLRGGSVGGCCGGFVVVLDSVVLCRTPINNWFSGVMFESTYSTNFNSTHSCVSNISFLRHSLIRRLHLIPSSCRTQANRPFSDMGFVVVFLFFFFFVFFLLVEGPLV
jgi:hypothetical protein